MMKFVFFCVCSLAVAFAGDFYTTKYDNIDIDSILASPRLLNNYINCLLDKGRCNQDGQTLKTILPDALITDCRKCNEKQKVNIEKVIKFVAKNRPQQWNELTKKYDPKGEYRSKYQNRFH